MNYYIIFYVLGGISILIALFAQVKVQSTFNKYNKVISTKGTKACEYVQKLLDENGLNDIVVKKCKGYLTDHYNPRKKEICLSEYVHDSASLSALGVAAHEVGHAIQYKEKYIPIIIRNIIAPVMSLASKLLIPLILIGLLISLFYTANANIGVYIMLGACGFYVLSVLFNLVTLPVEFNASRRATQSLEKSSTLTSDETDCAKKVLQAAALTYVASLIVSILELVRILIILNPRRD